MNEKVPNSHRESTDESKEKAIADFVEKIQSLQEKYHIHGHGVSNSEEAASVEAHGLFTAWSTLQDLTHKLSEDPNRLAEQIHAWDYGARQYVVLVAVPKHAEYYASDVADEGRSAWENRERSRRFATDHVFEPAEQPDGLRTPLKTDKRIPPKRIIGYWDDNQKAFHPNPHFEDERL